MSLGARRDFGASEAQQRILQPQTIYPDASILDRMLVEDVLLDASYVPVIIGTPRKGATDYKLVAQKEVVADGNQQFMRRVWSTAPVAESWHNLSLKYFTDSYLSTTYLRRYRILKSLYAPLVEGTALGAVVSLVLTAGGSGYTTAPAVTIAAGSTTATAVAQIRDGAVIAVQLTTEGSGYTTAPAVTFSGGGGTGATATAGVQDQTALLVEQQATPAEGEMGHLFFDVVRMWQVLPSAYIPFTRWNERLGPIQGKRRLVRNTSQTPTKTATVNTTYDARGESSVVAWELVETNSNGTGGAGNPTYPIITEHFWDDERGDVSRISQVVVQTGSEEAALSFDGPANAFAHLTEYKGYPDNPFLVIKVIETWFTPGPVRKQSPQYDPERGQIASTIQLVKTVSQVGVRAATSNTQYRPSKWGPLLISEIIEDWADDMPNRPAKDWHDERGAVASVTERVVLAGGEVASMTLAGTTVTQIEYRAVDEFMLDKVTMTWELPGPILTDSKTDEDGETLVVTRRMVDASTATPSESVAGFVWTRVRVEALNAVVARLVTETRPINSHTIAESRLDDDGAPITITRSLVSRASFLSIGTYESISGGLWRRYTYRPVTELVGWQSFETRSIPGTGVTSTRIDQDGTPVTTTRRLKDASTITTAETLAAGVWTTVTRKEITALAAWEITETRAIPGTLLTYKLYDAVTDSIVEETRQLIDAATAAPSITSLYTDYRDVPQGSVVKTRILRTYPAGITSKTIIEYKRERFIYPAIIATLNGAIGALTRLDGTKEFPVSLNIQAERPLMVPHKLTTTFTTTLPDDSAIMTGTLDIQTLRLTAPGPLFRFQTGPVLCNAGTLTATTGTNDPEWGSGVVQTLIVGDSAPSAATYLAARAAGSWFILHRESRKIAQGLYMVTKVEIPYK